MCKANRAMGYGSEFEGKSVQRNILVQRNLERRVMRTSKWMFTAALLLSVSAAAQQPAESQPLSAAANGPLPTDSQPLSVGSVPQIAGGTASSDSAQASAAPASQPQAQQSQAQQAQGQ